MLASTTRSFAPRTRLETSGAKVLIAPVEIGDGATIGAGSTVTRNAPPGELTLSRAPQETRKGWQRPVKKK